VDLDFTDEQETLRASVREVLTRECPPNVVRALAGGGEYPDALWKRMVDLDWPLLTVPEDLGGVGYGFVELAVVAEELGRVAAPSPFEAVATQYQPLLVALGAPLTPARTGTVAFTGAVTATADGALHGEARGVFDADAVDELLVVSDLDGAPGVVRVDPAAAGVTITPLESFDPSRRLATIVLDGATGDVVGAPGPDTARAVQATIDGATAVIAIETVGACQTLFDLTLEYAKVREQFGVAIGSFQAIKHKLADMFIALERARVTAYYAAAAIAEDDERASLAVSMAKAAAGDAQRLIAQDAIQTHGGIGYTWEHDLHLFVKRAKGGDALFGTAAEHRQRIAAHLVRQ
jgi:alkylation response protein AidB-like acyl-CoA dehydrogenase